MMVNGSMEIEMEKEYSYRIQINTLDIGKMVIKRGQVPSQIKMEINM